MLVFTGSIHEKGRAMGAIANVVVGLVLIIGGLSGYITMKGGTNGWVFALVGVVIGGYGVWRVIQERNKAKK